MHAHAGGLPGFHLHAIPKQLGLAAGKTVQNSAREAALQALFRLLAGGVGTCCWG
jgi:hypothetical protein